MGQTREHIGVLLIGAIVVFWIGGVLLVFERCYFADVIPVRITRTIAAVLCCLGSLSMGGFGLLTIVEDWRSGVTTKKPWVSGGSPEARRLLDADSRRRQEPLLFYWLMFKRLLLTLWAIAVPLFLLLFLDDIYPEP